MRSLHAISIMLISMAFFSGMNTAIRMLSHEMHSTQIVLLRNVLSLALILLWQSVALRGLPRFPTARLSGHFWRATFGIVAMEMWFHGVALLPLTLATALSFTTPIFSTIIAIFALHEKVGIRRWGAIFTGFAGVLVMLRPDVAGISPEAFFVLGSSVMMAVAGVLVKTLTRTEAPLTIVFYMALFMIPWAIPLAIFHWQTVTLYQLWLALCVAALSTIAHILLATALSKTDMVVLTPFDFSRLIFTALLAYAFFGEVLDTSTVIGSLIIIASTGYIAHREARLKPRATPPAPC